MKGLGTDDDTLCRVVVSRCEVDMVQIKEEFQRQYKQTLGMFMAVSTQELRVEFQYKYILHKWPFHMKFIKRAFGEFNKFHMK